MIVISMTNCPNKLRGDLTKWLCEINTGVYVGQVSAKVRDALWKRICENVKGGQVTMVYSCANEQHFEFRVHNTTWKIRDYDGIKLMMRPVSSEENEEVLPEHFSKASGYRIAGRRKNKTIHEEDELVFLDIETTGLNAESDRIIEIAAITVRNGEKKSVWTTLVKTELAIPSQIVEITQITDGMLQENGVEMVDALQKFGDIVKDKTLVCYNQKFDIVFLENEYRKEGVECPFGKIVDVLPLARKRLTDITNYKLGSLAEYFGIEVEKRHRALADCEILYQVFLKLNEI